MTSVRRAMWTTRVREGAFGYFGFVVWRGRAWRWPVAAARARRARQCACPLPHTPARAGAQKPYRPNCITGPMQGHGPSKGSLRVPRPGGKGAQQEPPEPAGEVAPPEGGPEVPPGRFVVLEGIDGTGKSHLTKEVVRHLESRGVGAIPTSEPTEGPAGRLLRHAADGERMDPYTELFLFLADRAEHTHWVRERLKAGDWVVCDRYAMSSAAYQGTSLEGSWELMGQDPVVWIMDVQRRWWLQPDLTVLVVDDVERCLSRVAKRGRRTKFERAAYLTRVQENYLRLADVLEGVTVVEEPALDALVQAVLGRVEALLGNSHLP